MNRQTLSAPQPTPDTQGLTNDGFDKNVAADGIFVFGDFML